MKKFLLLTVVGLLVLAFAASFVSAATTPPQNHPQRIALTDVQKQELAPLFTQMMNIRKQILKKLVTDGTITQADADQRAAWMQERMNYRMQNDIGGGHGPGMMGSGHGRGLGNGFDPRGQQQPPVSNQ